MSNDPEQEDVMRWRASIYYRTDNGIFPIVREFDEIYELHDVVEHGPHWDTIDHIDVRRIAVDDFLTVEESMTL